MVSTFTPNVQLEEPARGDQVGTWDTPVNNNMTLTDLIVGGTVTIALNNSPVVLSSPQFQCKSITFNSTLTGNVAITFPTSFKKSYEIYNACTGSSAFVVVLLTTAAGGQFVAACPGEIIDIVNDGGNLRYKNLGRIGSYVDYAGSSSPLWLNFCSVPPYLNCDATVFSSATYPVLTTILGGTTLPDRRGTAGYTLNQGTARLTLASGGLDGNTIRATKTTDSVTLGTSNLPAYTPTGTVTGTASNPALLLSDGIGAQNLNGGTNGFGWSNNPTVSALSYVLNAVFGGTAQGGVSDPLPAIGTGTVYGICLIRAG